MAKLLVSSLGLAALALPSRAQSINVDFESATAPNGTPPASYGASAHSPGVWNSVNVPAVSGLVDVSGAPTSVSLATTGTSNNFITHDFPSTSGTDELLLDDAHVPDDFVVDWVFNGLSPGFYLVDTIIVAYGNADTLYVSVQGSPDSQQQVWGSWSGSYLQGINFARHGKMVTDGRIRVTIGTPKIHDYVWVSGIQLVQTTAVGTAQCFGDGSAGPCPCNNNGQAGRGCANSYGAGALLYATGTTSPDTAVLHASSLNTSSTLSIFLQGSASVGPLVFGDGLRCAGGILKRLYVKTPSGGGVYAPRSSDPSITSRSATLGDPILPGQPRYYQVYYRDGFANWCPPPQGSSYNATNAVQIVW
jgi:hypothetical protein